MVQWSILSSLFSRQMFLVPSAVLLASFNSLSLKSWNRHLSVQLWNHTWNEAIYNVSVHQLPQVASTTWITLFMLYGCCKLVHTKILQKFWLTLVFWCKKNCLFDCLNVIKKNLIFWRKSFYINLLDLPNSYYEWFCWFTSYTLWKVSDYKILTVCNIPWFGSWMKDKQFDGKYIVNICTQTSL